jgi:hypothetical protein
MMAVAQDGQGTIPLQRGRLLRHGAHESVAPSPRGRMLEPVNPLRLFVYMKRKYPVRGRASLVPISVLVGTTIRATCGSGVGREGAVVKASAAYALTWQKPQACQWRPRRMPTRSRLVVLSTERGSIRTMVLSTTIND